MFSAFIMGRYHSNCMWYYKETKVSNYTVTPITVENVGVFYVWYLDTDAVTTITTLLIL